MSILDELRVSRQSPATAHLQFLQNQKYGGIHAFMEGNSDPSFYRTTILKFHSDSNSVFIYDCGGKKRSINCGKHSIPEPRIAQLKNFKS